MAKPHGKPEVAKDFKNSSKKLLKALKKHLFGIIIATVFSVGSTAISIIGPDKVKELTNEIIVGISLRYGDGLFDNVYSSGCWNGIFQCFDNACGKLLTDIDVECVGNGNVNIGINVIYITATTFEENADKICAIHLFEFFGYD